MALPTLPSRDFALDKVKIQPLPIAEVINQNEEKRQPPKDGDADLLKNLKR